MDGNLNKSESKSFDFLGKLDHYLEDDLVKLKILKKSTESGKKALKEGRSKHQQEFIKYLVSVATHSIGLRASVSPFNCSQETMLAYIMDMFSLNDNKIRKIVVGGRGQSEDQGGKEAVIDVKKRHSWRPELKIRLSAPIFFYNEQFYLENLYVRVYIFKDEQIVAKNETELDEEGSDSNVKRRGVLNRIFKRLRLESSVLIRPINELRCLVRFQPTENAPVKTNVPKVLTHRMIQLSVADSKVENSKNDLRLGIRRYYCEPKGVHILRFEFWQNSNPARSGCFNKYRQHVRQLVYNGCCYYCLRGAQSTYMNEKQEFYGYVNIRLTQVPSYAFKKNYPILSLHGRKVNNCEISLDVKNRRIHDDQITIKPGVQPPPKRNLKEEFLVNHLRLYVNCVLYHSSSLKSNIYERLLEKESFKNITIDNLLYLPAYTLINQHRLQSNLDAFEDQCLRRVSILLLLMKLERHSKDEINPSHASKIISIRYILISVLQNEYIAARRIIDDKTMQEVDLFQGDPGEDFTKKLVLALEIKVLKDFVDKFLTKRLKKWLFHSGQKTVKNDLDHSTTLLSLKLVKTAVFKFKKNYANPRLMMNTTQDVSYLRSSVERLLCEIVINYVKIRIESIIILDNRLDMKNKAKIFKTRSPPTEATNKEIDRLWLQLLHDIKYISNDISLYWSSKGLDGIIINEQNLVKRFRLFEELERKDFKTFIQAKIDNYLR